jgi:hypothetical protein
VRFLRSAGRDLWLRRLSSRLFRLGRGRVRLCRARWVALTEFRRDFIVHVFENLARIGEFASGK